jgi:hypothetical protein
MCTTVALFLCYIEEIGELFSLIIHKSPKLLNNPLLFWLNEVAHVGYSTVLGFFRISNRVLSFTKLLSLIYLRK